MREFTGRVLSEPKPQAYFTPPRRPLARAAFARQGRKEGVALDSRARLLYGGQAFFLNGDEVAAPAPARAMLRRLADSRRLFPPIEANEDFWTVIHGWYMEGFVHLAGAAP